MENSSYVLTSKERLERLTAGGLFSLTAYGLAVFFISHRWPAWAAFLLFLPVLGGLSCFLQAASHLCGFRGLFIPVSRGKAAILWAKALTGAFLLTGALFFILSKGLFTNNQQ